MVNLRELTICYPNQLFLEISELDQQQSWTIAQKYSNPTARCQAHINYLCKNIFISWLQSWLEEETITQTSTVRSEVLNNSFLDYTTPEIWEFINGSLIIFQDFKLALIPCESTDLEEFDIPQEWVDIPQWQADYYLAIQINFDIPQQSWIRVKGYISHQELLKKGGYDQSDRIYYINRKYLTEEISSILLSSPGIINKKKPTETKLELSDRTRNRLLQDLGNPLVYNPRLAIPFQQWQILITNPQWRKQLYEQRTSSFELMGSLVKSINLRDWLENLVKTTKEGWQTLDPLITPIKPIAVRGKEANINLPKESIISLIDLLRPHNSEKERSQAAGVLGKIGAGYPEAIAALIELFHTAKEEETRWEAALSLGKIDPDNPLAGVTKGKLIDLGLQLEDRKIVLIVAIAPKNRERIGVWIQLKPIHHLTKLPPNLQLKVVSEGNILLAAESRSNPDGTGKDECIQLRFTPPKGTDFTVKVTLNHASFTESFIT